jgi:hypothetical protein
MKSLKLKMKQGIKDAAFAMGFNLTTQLSADEVRTLVRTLRPVDCGIDLIRIGPRGDGGYLIPNDLEGIEYCFSPGVSALADFESHLATLGIKSYLADYSVDAPPIHRPELTFDKKFLGANDSETFFTLESWMNKYLPESSGDLLLQMDIEGFEYEVILSTPPKILDGFRIMVIEFHFLEKLFDPFTYRLYKACFDKLSTMFHVAHLHPNNCCGSVRKGDLEIPRAMEFTFYNKRRVSRTEYTQALPHPLDSDNVSHRESLLLPKSWYA